MLLQRYRCRALAALATLSLAVGATPTPATAAASSATAAPATSAAPAMVCNNSPELCSRAYNNVTNMGAHDSAFLRDASTDNSLAGNQFFNATYALSAGLRLLQVQVHVSNGELRLCHTSCDLLDAGPLADWLGKVAAWMDDHPTDVVTLLLVNSDNADAATIGAQFQAADLVRYGYAPAQQGARTTWPTIGDMISAGTRLVTFVASVKADAGHPYLLPEFDYMFETAYEVFSASGFNCSLDRPSQLGDSTSAIAGGYMGLVNHMLETSITGSIYIPDMTNLVATNSDTLDSQLGTCVRQWGIRPQFILVDFWDQGDVMASADSLNGLSAEAVSGRVSPPSGGGGGDPNSAPARVIRRSGWTALALAVVAGAVAVAG